MGQRKTLRQFARRSAKRIALLCGAVFLFVSITHANPLSEYQKHLGQAITALDSLAQMDENETAAAFATRGAETINSVRQLLPVNESVETSQGVVTVDNSWLHPELNRYQNASPEERAKLSQRIVERLQSILERTKEFEPAQAASQNKEEQSRKLAEILRRPEYARNVKQETALGRLWRQFVKWLENLIPKPKPIKPGTASIFSNIAQVFVLALALVVLIFVAKLFLPRLLRSRRAKRKVKESPRIVLGERLEPDQSATDLLAEAEALARSGDLRAAIRKAYIALLLELGERKIITLEQHRTNHDYLRAVRGIEPLYPNVKKLTDSFEQHWYGLARATENDWLAFRSVYKEALSS